MSKEQTKETKLPEDEFEAGNNTLDELADEDGVYRDCGMFLPSFIADEIEVETTQDIDEYLADLDPGPEESSNDIDNLENFKRLDINEGKDLPDLERDLNVSAMENFVKNPGEQSSTDSESFNGAVRDNYSWSQIIGEIDITIKLPKGITSSKKIKVNTTAEKITVQHLSDESKWVSIIDEKLTDKIRFSETVWVMSEGCIRIHLEKQKEKWWNSLLESEPKLDTSTLNCSRPLDELPEEDLQKINELRFNHLQKLAGKPTSEDMKREEMLRRAWDAPGSPFLNTPFDPTVFSS